MGKDYSTDAYKKSYSNEYIRSYAKNSEQQSQYNESVAEYHTISKKIGTRTYSKSEKSIYNGLQALSTDLPDTVRAEGRRHPAREKHLSPTPSAKKQEVNKPKPATAHTTKATKQKETPPPYIPDSEKKEPTKSSAKKAKTQSDYSYIDPNSKSNPITLLSKGNYRNNYTNKEIDSEEARRVLEYAGYEPKEMMSLKIFFFLCLLAIPIGMIGPILIIIWGVWTFRKTNVVMQRIEADIMLRMPIAANNAEIFEYKKRGVLFIVVGILIAILQQNIYS